MFLLLLLLSLLKGGESGKEFLMSGAIESSLGVMLGALGGDNQMWSTHEAVVK
jgi:hypothetical protein